MQEDEGGLLVFEETRRENEIEHQREMLRSASEDAVMKTVNEDEDFGQGLSVLYVNNIVA